MATETDIREALRHVIDAELLNAAALLLFMFNTGRSMTLGGMRGESN
jgi:hypothetical protein